MLQACVGRTLKVMATRPALRSRRFALQNMGRLRYCFCMKIVGKRRTSESLSPISPAEALVRAVVLQRQVDLLNPYPRPRGFVFKARTREEYERWRKAQTNPRLW